MSKLSFRARALDASKPMPIYLAEELPDLPDYSAINRAVPQMPSGMEKEEESEHHLQRAISGTGLIIPTPEVCQADIEFYERCYPSDYKMPKQHIHMQPLWEEQETPEYDIDSEDERWLKQQRHPELTELKFEQMMDKLEKSSGQTVVTLSEAKLLLERQDDLVIAVYDYWLNKRLTTQHPLILSVKTENRPGQSTNNPYLAFRRRTEKMQTRKNRKNDESSYEKMLKLRRELATALTLLEMVARREKVKREMVKLTAMVAEKRYEARDFTNQLPEPTVRPQLTTVPLASLRREFAFTPRPPSAPTTVETHIRQREKRPYKRRKHRHHTPGTVQGVRECTSSEEESVSPIDDGPFAFRRKPGCYYEMPTSTLCGDPADPASPSKDGLFQHELDERTRFTLTSVRSPYPRYIGFARRRLGRGGRVILDRVKTELDPLWPRLPLPDREKEEDIENQRHRTPKEITRDYHSGGKHPWRHAFRKHLAKNPHLWIDTNVKSDSDDVKFDIDDIKIDIDDVKIEIDDVKFDFRMEVDDGAMDLDNFRNGDSTRMGINSATIGTDNARMDFSDRFQSETVRNGTDSAKLDSDSEVNRTIDSAVRGNLKRVMRKRVWSSSTDYDSDESLQPVEREFESFITEVQEKWLHFRPKTPSPTPIVDNDLYPLSKDTPISVELTSSPSHTFTTEFTLADVYGNLKSDHSELTPDNEFKPDSNDLKPGHSGFKLNHTGFKLDNSGSTDTSDEIENFTGLTNDQVESILSETDLKVLEDKRMSDDLLEELVKDSFLLQGQSVHGRTVSGPRREPFGSTRVRVCADSEPICLQTPTSPQHVSNVQTPVLNVQTLVPNIQTPVSNVQTTVPATQTSVPSVKTPVPNVQTSTPVPKVQAKGITNTMKTVKHEVPTSRIIVEEVNEINQPIKVEPRREKEDLPQSVQLKPVHSKNSPVKKHIITSSRRPGDVTIVTSDSHSQLVTVAVSDSLKVRLGNQATTSQGTVVGLLQNGPFAVTLPVHSQRDIGATNVANVVTAGSGKAPTITNVANVSMANMANMSVPRRSAPLVQLTPHKPLLHPPTVVVTPQNPPGKLKVLHAHPLTPQRAQLLAQNRQLSQLPAVVSLATIDSKPTLLKTPVTQFFEIKSGQLSKGPHLVNVIRPQAKTGVNRLDFDKKRVVFDGKIRPRLLDGRQIVRATLPRSNIHQIQLKNHRVTTIRQTEPSTSIQKTAIPSVMNLIQKSVIPKGQKIAISGPAGQLSANVQAIAFTTAQLKARQTRLITQARPATVAEMEPTTSTSTSSPANMSDTSQNESDTNGSVRRRPTDTLPMEVT